MNSGIAMMGKESVPVISCCTMKLLESRELVKTTQREARPMAMPTGTFRIRKMIRETNKIIAAWLILHTPPRF